MSAGSKESEPIFDPVAERLWIVSDLSELVGRHVDAVAIHCNPDLSSIQVLSGKVALISDGARAPNQNSSIQVVFFEGGGKRIADVMELRSRDGTAYII